MTAFIFVILAVLAGKAIQHAMALLSDDTQLRGYEFLAFVAYVALWAWGVCLRSGIAQAS